MIDKSLILRFFVWLHNAPCAPRAHKQVTAPRPLRLMRGGIRALRSSIAAAIVGVAVSTVGGSLAR